MPSSMANNSSAFANQSSHRPMAMFLASILAVVLSPFYMERRDEYSHSYETRWKSGFVLPMLLAGLIIAIRTTWSPPQKQSRQKKSQFAAPEASWVVRIGGSSWGLAGVLVMLMYVLSWQDSVHHLFWS